MVRGCRPGHDDYVENCTSEFSSPLWGEEQGEGETQRSTLTPALSRQRERGYCIFIVRGWRARHEELD
jgi:hypothetical protein